MTRALHNSIPYTEGASVYEIEFRTADVEYDYDIAVADGEIYEVEFKQGGYEYSYDIDANNFSIIEWDKDYDD